MPVADEALDILFGQVIHLLPTLSAVPGAHHGVVTQTDHVPLTAMRFEVLPEPVASFVGVIHMHDNDDIGEDFFGGFVTHGGEPCIMGPTIFVEVLVFGIIAHPSHGP